MSESANSRISPGSVVCKNAEIFGLWAQQAHCDPLPEQLAAVDPEALPEPLLSMVKESKKIPKWLFDKSSETYGRLKLSHRGINMPEFIARPDTNTEELPDPTTVDLLFDTLPNIVHISNHHRRLLKPREVQFVNATALRQPIDRLMNHVWDEELGTDRFMFRLDCRLRLPSTEAVQIDGCTAGSVVFFCSPSLPIEMFSSELREGLVCTSAEPQLLEFVHWVTEYKRADMAEVCRKVCYGMISSLWQRRAIGRTNDFVFGAGLAGHSMTVYAARWEAVKSTEQPTEPDGVSGSLNAVAEVNIMTPGEPESSKPTSAKPEGSRSRSASGKKTETTPSVIDSQIGDSRKRHQIKIYKIGEYTTLDAVQMIEYYLLLRASFGVAYGYLDEILSNTGFVEKAEAHAKVFGWPFPPKPNTKSHTNSVSRQDMEFVSEELDASGSCQAPLVVDPAEEATWSKEWEEQARRAVDEFGPGSLDELVSVTSDYTDRLSHYLNHIG
ncbi:hypothetical protein FRC09_010990 [Ceratobasidium sp. 395]|nr:hypothetical protein FRC09_010990 [Ceratobasidium sp. 395]